MDFPTESGVAGRRRETVGSDLMLSRIIFPGVESEADPEAQTAARANAPAAVGKMIDLSFIPKRVFGSTPSLERGFKSRDIYEFNRIDKG